MSYKEIGMRLTEEQLREYNEKGFVFLPNALEKQEIEMMRDELARVATVDTDAVVKEKSGDVRSIFRRSAEHTSELQSLMRISYAVFCLKKTQPKKRNHYT